jgi:T5SS/PEP-CTERM-associated repeat protein/autotransporter-associated beta strand protein
VLLAAVGFGSSTASAAITLTGDVLPSPAAGDPWSVGGQLSVGDTLIGTMAIDSGSNVSNMDGYVGNNAASQGTVTVTGQDSRWTNAGELLMGNSGTGTLNITAGGAVSVAGHARIGNVEGGVGTATVDGAGSMLTSSNNVLVGRAGSGTLNIQNSGIVSDSIGSIAIFEGSGGTVTINGAGSAWNNVNELQVADGGNATLNILDGGTATTSLGYVAVSAAGVGNVTVSGAGSRWTSSSQLQVGYGGSGTLNVMGGGTVNSGLGWIGVLAGGSGNVTISGPDSTWSNANDLQVGYDGSGTLNMNGGATVTSGRGILGSNPDGSGTVTVSGSGSTWTNFGTLQVGAAGAGTLRIEDGGLVSAATLTGGNATSGVYLNGGTLRIMSTGFASTPVTFTGGGMIDVSIPSETLTLSSDIAGPGGLTKLGAGTLELAGANAYGGDTRVAGGTLNIDQVSLNDAADVYLSPGTSLGLNYAGTDTIDSLFINGASQAIGTYGGIGSGANFEMPIFAGPGLLRVSSLGIAGDYNDDGLVNAADYVVWAKTDSSEIGYGWWRANFGNSLGAGATSSPHSAESTSSVPEPASVWLLSLAMGATMLRGLRRRARRR